MSALAAADSLLSFHVAFRLRVPKVCVAFEGKNQMKPASIRDTVISPFAFASLIDVFSFPFRDPSFLWVWYV